MELWSNCVLTVTYILLTYTQDFVKTDNFAEFHKKLFKIDK